MNCKINGRVLFLALVLSLITVVSGWSQNTVKIGGLHIQSGGPAATYPYIKNSVEVLVQQVNAAGGINGKQIEYITRDSQGDPGMVAQKLNELKAAGCVAILGPTADTEGPAAAKWAKDNKFPIVLPSTLSTKVSVENANRYTFASGVNAWAIGRLLAQNAVKAGKTSYYFIGADGGAPSDVRFFFEKEALKLNPKFKALGSSRVGQSASEFSNIVTAAKAKGPDVLLGAIAGPSFISFTQQAVRFNFFAKTDYYGWYVSDPSNTQPFGKDSYPVGKTHGLSWAPYWIDDPAVQKWQKAYFDYSKGMYPGDLAQSWYQGLTSIIEALKVAPAYDAETIVNTMETVKFKSQYGDCYYRDFDHQLVFPMFFVDTAYKDGWPQAVGANLVKYGEEVLPTREEMAEYKKSLGL